jgi:transposase
MDSTAPQDSDDLFGPDPELGLAPASRVEQSQVPAGAPRLLLPKRDQVELHAFDLEASVPPDHPVRSVWQFVLALDLQVLRAAVKSVQGRAGAPAIDPAVLVALWLWATVDGVGSAREIDRLCQRDHAYRWICGGVGVNYHTLADFRTRHSAWLEAQLTSIITCLLDRRLITLQVVAQDGIRVRAHAKASSMRRRDRLQALHQQARAQVQMLRDEVHCDPAASSRRRQAAQERAAREREQRLSQALATLDKIDALKTKTPGKLKKNKTGGKHPGNDHGPQDPSVAPGERDCDAGASAEDAAKSEGDTSARVSTTDSEVRVMKMADGGFRPAFNAQLAVDAQTQLIAAVQISNNGGDMGAMLPMYEHVQECYQVTPTHWLADGGYPKFEAIEALSNRGTQPVVPPSKGRHGRKALQPRKTDSPVVAAWRDFMGTGAAQALYKQRAASVECANAHLRRRGLTQFNVRGTVKAKAVVLWHALAHNLMRLRSLGLTWRVA